MIKGTYVRGPENIGASANAHTCLCQRTYVLFLADLPLGQEFSRQPLADRLVVGFQAKISQQDASEVNRRGYRPDLPEGVELVVDQPSVEQVHDRVVNGIKREGDVAGKFADPRRAFVRGRAGGSQPDKYREDEEDADRLE